YQTPVYYRKKMFVDDEYCTSLYYLETERLKNSIVPFPFERIFSVNIINLSYLDGSTVIEELNDLFKAGFRVKNTIYFYIEDIPLNAVFSEKKSISKLVYYDIFFSKTETRKDTPIRKVIIYSYKKTESI